jgi:hypothetical protein
MSTSPFPYEVPVSPETMDRNTGRKSRSPYFSQEIVDWLLEQQQGVNNSPTRFGGVSLTLQGASVPSTPIPMPALSAGLYRVSVYARITRAGSVSSSLIVTIGHTDGAVSCTQSTPALITNTTASFVGATFVVRSDASVALTYATTYADGGGALSMQYALSIVVEAMPN